VEGLCGCAGRPTQFVTPLGGKGLCEGKKLPKCCPPWLLLQDLMSKGYKSGPSVMGVKGPKDEEPPNWHWSNGERQKAEEQEETLEVSRVNCAVHHSCHMHHTFCTFCVALSCLRFPLPLDLSALLCGSSTIAGPPVLIPSSVAGPPVLIPSSVAGPPVLIPSSVAGLLIAMHPHVPWPRTMVRISAVKGCRQNCCGPGL